MEQCGALSQSSGLGPLFFAKSSLQAKPVITLNCININTQFFEEY